MDEVITLQFDGGSRGNPGPAGIGVVLRAEDGTPLVTLGRFIGRATNNVAEYKALIAALEQAKQLGATKVVVRGDSELVVKQMRGEYRVKNADLRPLYERAQDLLAGFATAKVEHNYRESNALADKLANLAMDRRAEVTDPDDVGGDRPGPGPKGPRGTDAVRAPGASGTPSRGISPPFSDGPQGRVSGGRGKPERAPGRTAPDFDSGTTSDALPAVDSDYECPRCGCAVRVTNPSSRPAGEVGVFLCVCGVRMKARGSGDI